MQAPLYRYFCMYNGNIRLGSSNMTPVISAQDPMVNRRGVPLLETSWISWLHTGGGNIEEPYLKGQPMDSTETLLQELTEAHGVSGYEAEVRAVKRQHLEHLGALEQDKIGA
jgi:hypothetical protein